MNFLHLLIPLMLLISGSVLSQNAKKSGDYFVIDTSKSLPGNETIDRLQMLISYSTAVELPKGVMKMLNEVQDQPELHSKLTYMRASVLKVLYNDKVSPDDKRFISNHYVNNPYNEKYEPILPILQKYLSKGTL